MYGRRINLRKEGGQISGRSIEAHPPEFDFARVFFGLWGAIEGYFSLFRLQVTIVVAFLCSSLFLDVCGILFQTLKNLCTEDYSKLKT